MSVKRHDCEEKREGYSDNAVKIVYHGVDCWAIELCDADEPTIIRFCPFCGVKLE